MKTLAGRTAVVCGLAVAAVAALSCRAEKPPTEPASPTTAVQARDPGGPPSPVGEANDVAPPPAEGEEPGAEAPGSQTGPSGAPVLDKDRLWACYQEVYCAQKKGEMDRILDIYRQCGFQNPGDFTTAWIEAAKDTEWVSRLAHEVSKACK